MFTTEKCKLQYFKFGLTFIKIYKAINCCLFNIEITRKLDRLIVLGHSFKRK